MTSLAFCYMSYNFAMVKVHFNTKHPEPCYLPFARYTQLLILQWAAIIVSHKFDDMFMPILNTSIRTLALMKLNINPNNK